ncbi:MAG: PhzF family phenazine biosynthesis protein [Gammaproteobacteria bacterium]|nr:PhzF family phenazine biosynthesis protein [Gammaproteobacteria bacterium]
MKLSVYQIDAFAENVFTGNPAAIVPLDEWLPDRVLQNIAQENNLSETAYFIKEGGSYHIRWFTPTVEVELCGHATLASAYVIFEIIGHQNNEIIFQSKNGELKVTKKGELLELDFPSSTVSKCETPVEITRAFGKQPLEVWKADDYLAVYENESDIVSFAPDFNVLRELKCRGVIVTARGETTDFVSRFFAPRYGIDEDPVTGSAHCELMPYWVNVLGKTNLSAAQLSSRGGKLQCELAGDRVLIAGKTVKYLEGTIEI